ncbi:cupin domain-containing protein [Microbispora sp. RL4-1S]|uniref:Cupin domain-containing protein n=1 Tax=Microbispora oryzae TaxID=2806554 RepID=A0A940WS54_9ACTN|nr:cupin domain-containing protein [Microbispora oryzae]MBP2708652.1 cupin domain-containing protein [Microbispora oryzae]
MLVMTLAEYPDGASVPAADDDEALRVAAVTFTGPETVIAVGDDGEVRFLRRDVTGAFVAIQRRPPVAEALDLLPHPEGGWFRETWRTSASFEPSGYDGPRRSATGIYFLLQPGEESVWHAVRSDEVWLWHRGGPLTLTLGGSGDRPGAETKITLGPDVENGEVPQALVPAGTWQAARPAGDEGVLVSCVVSPGFDFADFRAL